MGNFGVNFGANSGQVSENISESSFQISRRFAETSFSRRAMLRVSDILLTTWEQSWQCNFALVCKGLLASSFFKNQAVLGWRAPDRVAMLLMRQGAIPLKPSTGNKFPRKCQGIPRNDC